MPRQLQHLPRKDTVTTTLGRTIVARAHSSHALQLPTAAVVGPTLHGEGPHTGRPVSVVRLGMCNLACVWCDSSYTWDRSRYNLTIEAPDRGVHDICDEVASHGTRTTIVTGGEPLIHQGRQPLAELLIGLSAIGDVHLETNGTIPPTDHTRALVHHFAVSPKVSSSGESRHRRVRVGALRVYADLARSGRAHFQYVVTSGRDLDEVDEMVAEYRIPAREVWIVPEGSTADRMVSDDLAYLAQAVLARGYNLSTRLPVLIWGNRRPI